MGSGAAPEPPLDRPGTTQGAAAGPGGPATAQRQGHSAIDHAVGELERIALGVRAAFGGLSREELNWRPAAGSWSIAQCLDHLIKINRLYFPLLEAFRTGPGTPTVWERYSPLSGIFGRMLIRALSPENRRRTKTGPQAQPSASEIDDGIIDRFAHHQSELIGHLRAIPSGVDLKKTIITSPLLRWVTYSLDDCLTILVVHEKRHFEQAKRVMEAEGGPHAPGHGRVQRGAAAGRSGDL